MNIKSFFKKETPLQEKNRQFENTFPNRELLKKVKNLSLKQKRSFIVGCLVNSLNTKYLDDEVCLKLINIYKEILKDESLNQKENYRWITPKLIENDDLKQSYEKSNALLLTKDDLKQFSKFFFMLPLDLTNLFEAVETVMQESDENRSLQAVYQMLDYMHTECVKYPEIGM